MTTPFMQNAGQVSYRTPSGNRPTKDEYAQRILSLKGRPKLFRDFYKCWQVMARVGLDDQEILQVIMIIADAMDYHKGNLACESARNNNIYYSRYVWTRLAIPAIPKWNHSQLADSLHAWELIGLYPGLEFMNAWNQAAKSPNIVWDNADIQKIESANAALQLRIEDDILNKRSPASASPQSIPSSSRQPETPRYVLPNRLHRRYDNT